MTNSAPDRRARTLFWFRRDLRVHDNAGFFRALRGGQEVHAVFVFDRAILDRLPGRADRRVEFIWHSVAELKAALVKAGGDLVVLHDFARDAIPALAVKLKVDAVFANADYEPDARHRDAAVAAALAAQGIGFQDFKDTVVFEKSEVLTQAGTPFSVFTPYKRAWLKRLGAADLAPFAVEEHLGALAPATAPAPMPSLKALGFSTTNILSMVPAGMSGGRALVDDFVSRMDGYHEARDFPAIKGGSYLSVHNRFGTVSIRQLASIAHRAALSRKNPGAETWLSELIWREFYFQILWHHPHVATASFKPEHDNIAWENDESLYRAWCDALTGFPIIDAAMRQLNQTGYMHNRLRMIVASFLTKDLLIDWRRGERYFADHLNDYDLAANNGGWQWAASTGCDAQPYFRIFNPVSQSERFDPQGNFIRRYLPELAKAPDRFIHAPWIMPPLEQQACGVVVGLDYPSPIVDHAVQREKALAMYKRARA
jgi:deoxyribodipyrimidine photo-lyase